MRFMNSSINRALIFQGGGSLGAYEAGAYKAINEDLSAYFRTEGRGNEPIFHIVSGTSIGAINAALLVSYVKENKTWEGSAEKDRVDENINYEKQISFYKKNYRSVYDLQFLQQNMFVIPVLFRSTRTCLHAVSKC
jgi:predicted acylesterase/phospholipase RssA